jgi:toxin ParE1/3/4
LSAAYVLTIDAEADLRSIVRYTSREWGEAQVRRYMAKLARGIEAIASGRGRSVDVGELYPALRMARCEHHYIFCLPRDNDAALIVAIFHERMDLMARLSGRSGILGQG